jgi:RNA polymerase sigma factor (sigma-70 family)
MQISSVVASQSVSEATDGILAQQALSGDQTAFEKLVCRYSPPLFNYIIHMLGDYDLACDVLQQVFVQFYVSLASLRQERSFKGWFFRVAHNRCIDELRRKRVVYFSELPAQGDAEERETALADLVDPAAPPEETLEQLELQRLLRRVISSLPPRFRAVVALRYTAHLTFAEIGAALHMPEATAKTYFQRAKPLLRQLLRDSELVPDIYTGGMA